MVRAPAKNGKKDKRSSYPTTGLDRPLGL
jgi:hypothetical protein